MRNEQGITRRYTLKGRKTVHAQPSISVQETRLLELVSQIGVGRALRLIVLHLPSSISLLPFKIDHGKMGLKSDTEKTIERLNERNIHEKLTNKLGFNEEWEQIQERILQKISPPSFETWFRNTGATIAPENVLIIKCENEFQLDWLKERYNNIIQAAVHEVLGKQYNITFEVSK